MATTIKTEKISSSCHNSIKVENTIDSGFTKQDMHEEEVTCVEEVISGEPNKALMNKYASWSREQLISRLVCLEQTSKFDGLFPSSQQEKHCRIVRENGTNFLDSEESVGVVGRRELKKKKKKLRAERAFDPSKFNTQFVAFKLSYLGKRYNGFEYHINNKTPLPTIEEELWKSFTKAKLIFPQGRQVMGNWEGCDYSKCGRTDKGVSAFGQVISLRVRSNRPLEKINEGERRLKTDQFDVASVEEEGSSKNCSQLGQKPKKPTQEFSDVMKLNACRLGPPQTKVNMENVNKENDDFKQDVYFDPILDELPYATILNRLLPPDIRILAWCPVPNDFSARFACKERQYRYFFTQPCFPPIPHSMDPFYTPSSRIKDGYLDIEAMRAAAKLFEGSHDFRNLCKIDASKQIDNFVRCIYHADIEEVADTTSALQYLNSYNFQPHGKLSGELPKVYTFTLHGSAFLWHQVRHMVAILFLVGQGLESPSIVTNLLDIDHNPRRPTYQMAADTPLVLWDCIFTTEDDTGRQDPLQWIYVGDIEGTLDTKYGIPTGGLMDDLWRTWRERKVDEVLASSLLGLVAGQGRNLNDVKAKLNIKGRSQRVFDGSDVPKLQGTYVPVMKKPVMDTVSEINQRYADRKGFSNVSHTKDQDFKRVKIAEKDGQA